jgi:uncharacterized protein involved in tellurium resistance
MYNIEYVVSYSRNTQIITINTRTYTHINILYIYAYIYLYKYTHTLKHTDDRNSVVSTATRCWLDGPEIEYR